MLTAFEHDGHPLTLPPRPPSPFSRRQNINERRRRFEDNLAAIFMGFVLVFLVCHFPRLLLNIHELVTLRDALLLRYRSVSLAETQVDILNIRQRNDLMGWYKIFGPTRSGVYAKCQINLF